MAGASLVAPAILSATRIAPRAGRHISFAPVFTAFVSNKLDSTGDGHVLPTSRRAAVSRQADVGVAIGAGTDVAIETADVVLMRSDPLDVATAITIGRGTVRKMKQNLGWAIGYNSLALPIAAGVFAKWGLTLRPEIAAISMSGSSILVAVNAVSLKRLKLPGRQG